MKKTSLLVFTGLIAALQGVKGGDITGTITLKATPPAEQQTEKTDPNCGADNIARTHHYVVGSKGELANVVVSLVPPSPKSTGASAPPLMIDQKGCEYSPIIAAVQTEQKIMVKNSDPTLHNIH